MTARDTTQNVATQTEQGAEATPVGGAGADRQPPPAHDARQERIRDYLRSALAMKDPLAANVGAVNSDLMCFGYSLQRAITQALDLTPVALDEFGKLMPAIDAYLRISRQVERLAKLSQQLAGAAEARRVAEHVRPGEGVDAGSEETAS